jgi:hypothetical protein
MTYIVMLRTQDGKKHIPLVDLEDDIIEFESEEDADKAGRSNMLGEAFGFDIYRN